MSREMSGEARTATFEQEWKRLGPQVAQRLSKQGISRDLVEDITQEAGIRLYQRWERIDHSKSILPLAHMIARNRLVDYLRAESRLQLEPSPLDSTRSDLTEQRALSRMQLDAAVRALPKLSDRYRRLILGGGRTGGVPSSTADRTARSRARARLREALGPWAPSAITVRLRYLRRHAAQKRSSLEMHAVPLANSLVNVATAAALALAGAAGTPTDPAEPTEPGRRHLFSWAQARDIDRGLGTNRRPKPPRDRATKPPAEGMQTGASHRANHAQHEIVDTWDDTVETWEDTVDTWHGTVHAWHETQRQAERETKRAAEETWHEAEDTWHEAEETWHESVDSRLQERTPRLAF